MQITLCAAVSLDGKLADKDHSVDWISSEDQTHLKNMIHDHDVLIMGRTTFENYKNHIDLKYKKRRIIMTRQPKKYIHEEIPDIIEFSKLQPQEMILKLTKKGFKKILILGGSYVFSAFITADLFTDLYLTIEPIVLGDGIPFLTPHTKTKELTLIEKTMLNHKGTILLHYSNHTTKINLSLRKNTLK